MFVKGQRSLLFFFFLPCFYYILILYVHYKWILSAINLWDPLALMNFKPPPPHSHYHPSPPLLNIQPSKVIQRALHVLTDGNIPTTQSSRLWHIKLWLCTHIYIQIQMHWDTDTHTHTHSGGMKQYNIIIGGWLYCVFFPSQMCASGLSIIVMLYASCSDCASNLMCDWWQFCISKELILWLLAELMGMKHACKYIRTCRILKWQNI